MEYLSRITPIIRAAVKPASGVGMIPYRSAPVYG